MAITAGISRTSEVFPRLPTPRVSTGSASPSPVAGDRVAISNAGRQQIRQPPSGQEQTGAAGEANVIQTPTSPGDLDATAQQALQALRQRDREVRLHEQAHLLTAGPFAKGGAQYTYKTGPDGQRYAIGGEVPIDLSAVAGDPKATIQKALTIRRAALAPADPSGPDLAIAAKAAALAVQAQQELSTLHTTRPHAVPDTISGAAPSDQGAASSTQTLHVCGPNCQEHDARRSAGTRQQVSGGPVPSGALAEVLATRAIASYQHAAHVAYNDTR